MIPTARTVLILALGLLAGCATSDGGTANNEELIDLDNDGFYLNAPVATDRDCADGDPTIYPGAVEVCDRRDNDCNQLVDDDAEGALEWYPDEDDDGFGIRSDEPLFACTAPDRYTANDLDCNDSDPRVYPNAPERCNELDDNCNLIIDEGIDLAQEWWDDRDRDGYGGGEVVGRGCSLSERWVRNGDDCNDLRDGVRPGAKEVCDGVDNDCDEEVDDADSDVVGAARYYVDADEDGYGDVLSALFACVQPLGTVRNALDCNDGDPRQNPDTIWYLDDDLDGDGTAAVTWPTPQCWQPIGYSINTEDCDDANPSVSGTTIWHPDADRDGFGAALTVGFGCNQQPGWVVDATDCNDRDIAISPAADEICDAIDNDCDGLRNEADDDLVDALVWFRDDDGDGFGRDDDTTAACRLPAGYATVGGDCNDRVATLNPETRWWRDADRDGGGDPNMPYATPSCEVVPGYVTNDDDCDDSDYFLTNETPWFPDLDQDGQGVGWEYVAFGCQTNPNLARDSGDCNDADPADVGGFCFGDPIGVVRLLIDVDADANNQDVLIQCVGQAQYRRTLRTNDRNTTIEVAHEVPAGIDCRVIFEGPTNDPSGDGAGALTYDVCGGPSADLIAEVGADVSTDALPVTRCSGCTDPTAINYDPAALVSLPVCYF